jgi:sugar lactone lactonase YvrE
MDIKSNLRKVAELCVGVTAVATLALAGCGGGSSSGGQNNIAALVSGQVTTFAGTAGVSGVTNGSSSTARFFSSLGITSDGTNLYVADWYSSTIRKIVIATGEVSTFAGSMGVSGVVDAPSGPATNARFNTPMGVTCDGTNLYVADNHNHNIRKIVIATGVVTTIAGSPVGAYGRTDNVNGIAATFFGPDSIAKIGNALYVADFTNNWIRKIDLNTVSAAVTTLAGDINSNHGYSDGIGASAVLYGPSGLATDGTSLYLVDSFNHNIRIVDPTTGTVTTFAGSNLTIAASGIGSTDATGTLARFNEPENITYDGNGNLYVTDTFNHTIRKIVISTGVVTTLAGTAGASGITDAIGSAARFNLPWGITSVSGVLYVTDVGNFTIRKIKQ